MLIVFLSVPLIAYGILECVNIFCWISELNEYIFKITGKGVGFYFLPKVPETQKE